jgi:hypothetical protein
MAAVVLRYGPVRKLLAQIFFASDVRMAPGVATGSGKSASSVQATLAWPRHRTDGMKRDQSSGHAEHPGGPGFWPHRIAGHNWRATLLHGNSVSFSTIGAFSSARWYSLPTSSQYCLRAFMSTFHGCHVSRPLWVTFSFDPTESLRVTF